MKGVWHKVVGGYTVSIVRTDPLLFNDLKFAAIMKRKPVALLTAAFLTLLFTGCDRAPSTAAPPTANSTVNGGVFTKNVAVSGQVFIVTKGGENFKLGLVRVAIADGNAVNDYKKSIADDINKKLSANKATIDAASADYNAAYEKYESTLTNYQNADTALQGALNASGLTYLSTMNEVDNVTAEQAGNIVKLDKQRADIGTKLALLQQDAQQKYKPIQDALADSQADVSANLPVFIESVPSVADTKTDADGRYSLSVPAGNTYVIVAKASREVGDDTEYYYWIQDVDLTKASDGLSIMLSNDNLVESVPDVPINTDLMASSVSGIGQQDIKTVPTSYTFKDNSGNAISFDATSMETTDDLASTAPHAPSVPTWTPPNPIPAQDNWTWTTNDKNYQNVVITGFNTDDDTVAIVHSTGVAHLDLSLLPSDIQKKLNYSPKATASQSPAPALNVPAPESMFGKCHDVERARRLVISPIMAI